MKHGDVTKKLTDYFPFSFNDELIFYKTDSFNESQFLLELNKLITNQEHSSIVYYTRASFLLKIPLKITFSYHPDLLTAKIILRVSLFELNITLFLFILFSIFFGIAHQMAIAITTGVSGLAVYGFTLNETLINIKKRILHLAGNMQEYGEAELWKMQQEWLKNPNLCPACGESRNPYSEKCVRCGLFLGKPRNEDKSKKINSTGSSKVVIQYHLKK